MVAIIEKIQDIYSTHRWEEYYSPVVAFLLTAIPVILLIIGTLLVAAVIVIIKGAVLWGLWNWFVCSFFNVPTMSLWFAVGSTWFVRFVSAQVFYGFRLANRVKS